MTALALCAWPVMRISNMARFPGFAAALGRRVPVILVLGFTLATMDLLRVFPLYAEAQAATIASGVLVVLVQYMATCLLLVAAITWAERSDFAASHRIAALGLAVIITAPLATGLGAGLSRLGEGFGWMVMASPNWSALYLYLLWYSLLVGTLAAAYFTTWDRARQSAADLRRAQIERQGMKQRMVESRLNVMKARVDPDFLFRMIGDVQRLYRTDIDAAEQRLEDFIQYLRAALPQMRSGATTLGEELHLAQAYVRLHEEAFEGRLDATFDVEEALADAQFPPMALLPLVDDALRRACRSLVLAVTARGTVEGLTVTVADDAGHEAQTPALASHERAFVQFFGEGARVIRRPGEVQLVIDHAIATRAHR